VRACIQTHTCFVDITGESPWVDKMRRKYGELAAKSKTLIVS